MIKKINQILWTALVLTVAALILANCGTSSDTSQGWPGGSDDSSGSSALKVIKVTNMNNPGAPMRSGDWITIEGAGFGASQGNGGVRFHFDALLYAFADVYSQWTDTMIVCRVPQAPTKSLAVHPDLSAPLPCLSVRSAISLDIVTGAGSAASSDVDYDPQPNPTPSSSPPETTPSPSPTVSPSSSPSPSPTVTVSPSPSPSPTQTGGGGGGGVATPQWWNLGNSALTQSINTKIKVGYDSNNNVIPYFTTVTSTPTYTVHVGCIRQSGYQELGSYPGGDQYYGDSLAVDGSTVYLATHYTTTGANPESVVAVNRYTWGSGWSSIGTISGCSYPWLCVNNGTPYLCAQNGSYVYIYKYTGSAWQKIQDFAGQFGNISYYNGTIYLSYLPYNSISSIKIESISPSGTYQSLGTVSGSGSYAPIFCGSSGLYVATNQSMAQLAVMQYSASAGTWSSVGGQLEASTTYITTYLGGLNEYSGSPCIAYMFINPATGSYAYNVKYLSGSSWVSLGSPSFSCPTDGWIRIALDIFNGVPYSSYIDGSAGNAVTVQKYSASKLQALFNSALNTYFSKNFLYN